MIKSIPFFIFLFVVSVTAWATDEIMYSNPVISRSTPDPTLIRAADGYFYLYATEDIRNTPIYRSNNLVDWSLMGTAFTNATRPTFEPNGGLWAPDINYIDGKYVLYYSMSVWGGEWTCGIGVATAEKPEGPFTDRGKLFRSNEIGVQNSIDPFYMDDNGKKYLFWGSFRGIYYVELSDDGLTLKNPANPQPQQIAGTAFEGTYIYKRDNYYYLFASVGSCCNGLNSTYRLVAGRSASLTGPYLNKQGESMMNNAYSLVVGSNSRFVGNGHCSEIVLDEAGNDWIFFHGWDIDYPDNKRGLLLNKLSWDRSGWPYVTAASPSIISEVPVFGTSGQKVVYEESVQLLSEKNSLTIQSSQPVSAKVFTITGQLVRLVEVKEHAQISLATGIYIVQVYTADYSMVKKIFIS
jgi:arabinan endo-1,5-alpha-L-arabinosidase